MKSTTLSVVSVNCNGLRDRKKRLKLYKWAQDLNIQILFLQETHFTKDIIDSHDKYDWHGRSFHSIGSSQSCGTSILIKGKEIEVIDQRSFHDGRLNAVNISYSGETFWLINIYAPNALKLRKTFFETCFQFLEEHVLPSEGVILGGDFNTVMNFKYDKMGGVMKDFQDAIHLRVQSASNYLIDIWRDQHLNDSEFTHEQSYKSQIIRTRIDFFLSFKLDER